MRFLIHSPPMLLFTSMMYSFFRSLQNNTKNTSELSSRQSSLMVLLSLLPKSNFSKLNSDSQALIFTMVSSNPQTDRSSLLKRTPSPSHSDLEAPVEPEDESPVNPYKGLMTIKKEFTPDMALLGKEFDLDRNRVKRESYRTNHTHEQILIYYIYIQIISIFREGVEGRFP